ncbi:MAG: hypothetical protein P4L26_01655 [Terracidiphilus sp.]|nr:hypothetical protein [Terracidiphilus sp.]
MGQLGHRLLSIYAALVSTVFAVVMVSGANAHPKQVFDEIQVHRINVVEPDGTLRMVISNKDRLPPVIVKGVAHPEFGEPRPQAGLLFYNDEGSENGGLIFGGRKNERGEIVDSGGSLSFDRYGAGQIVQLAGVEDATDRFAGLAVSGKNRRIWVGTTGNGEATISLKDASGKDRIVMQVPEKGDPSFAFLDENGHTVKRILP